MQLRKWTVLEQTLHKPVLLSFFVLYSRQMWPALAIDPKQNAVLFHIFKGCSYTWNQHAVQDIELLLINILFKGSATTLPHYCTVEPNEYEDTMLYY